MTLTGIAASDVIWESFERIWGGVLKSYSVAALHMSKLMHFREISKLKMAGTSAAEINF